MIFNQYSAIFNNNPVRRVNMLSVDLKDDRSEIVHYNFKDYPIYMRKALLSSYNNFEAPPHWHDDIEFISVLQGEMNYNINGEIITIKRNEGVFVNSRQLHYGFSKTKSECEFICVLIHPLMLCISEAIEQNYIVPLLENQSVPYIKLSAETPWQKESFDCILNMYNAKDDTVAPLMISCLFLKIWSLIVKNAAVSESPKTQSNDFTVLKNMIGYIQKFYQEKITLDDIAKEGAVGQSKCCKLFNKYIGITPNAYLVRYRLNQSAWYLKNTDMSIAEIAQAVGFSGSSFFAETFRKQYHKSPSEYRKTAKK